ncbi:MAG: sel1 repeat family protein [Rhodocyclaceae bacterium]|nr:sel1 repeat family protein [Rhodocyclaceae bacterium]
MTEKNGNHRLLSAALRIVVVMAQVYSASAVSDTSPKSQDYCAADDRNRITRALASLTDSQIKNYVERAEAGDVQAMGLLARAPKKMPDGSPDTAFANYWLKRAISAGDKSLDLRERRNVAIAARKWDEFLKSTIEETLRAWENDAINGSEPSAMALAIAYRNPAAYGYSDLKPDMKKSLYWYQFAANLGSQRAPVMLCSLHFQGPKAFGHEGEPDYQEAALWCPRAAHISCDAGGAINLSIMYEKGIGVPRNLEQALYWDQVARDRLSRDRPESITRRYRELEHQ